MIKDKLNRELKDRFQDAIKKTIDTGKEYGFYLCEDKEGKLFTDKICEGDECGLAIGRPRDACKGNINHGDFHTHPYTSISVDERMSLIRNYGYFDSKDKEYLKKIIRKEFNFLHNREGLKNMPISTPSYMDTIKALSFKCDNSTQGTVCIGTDIEKDRVECWTVKDSEKNDKNCSKAEEEYIHTARMGGEMAVKKWIVPIFDKEIIDLNND